MICELKTEISLEVVISDSTERNLRNFQFCMSILELLYRRDIAHMEKSCLIY